MAYWFFSSFSFICLEAHYVCVPNVCHFLPFQHNYSITISLHAFHSTSFKIPWTNFKKLDVKLCGKITARILFKNLKFRRKFSLIRDFRLLTYPRLGYLTNHKLSLGINNIFLLGEFIEEHFNLTYFYYTESIKIFLFYKLILTK